MRRGREGRKGAGTTATHTKPNADTNIPGEMPLNGAYGERG